MISALLKPLLPSIYRWAIYLAVAAGVGLAIYGKGYLDGDDHGQAAVRAQDATEQQAVNDRFKRDTQRGQELAGELVLSNTRADLYFSLLSTEAIHDPLPTVAAPGAPTSAPVLTARAVCLWNRAWHGYDLPGIHAAAGADAGPDCSAADAEGPSGYDVRDLIYSGIADARVCWADIRDYRQLLEDERGRAAAAQH